MAVDKARANSMPADNIKRAIERATGGGADAEQYEEITYEGIGPANVAVIVAAMTDNRNRTASEVRSVFTKARRHALDRSPGSSSRRASSAFRSTGSDPDEMTLAAIDAGARRRRSSRRAARSSSRPSPRDLEAVRRALGGCRLRGRDRPSCRMEPTTTVEIGDEQSAKQVLRFVERLEDLDDVQNVYANFDIPAELMERLEAQVVS